MVIRTHAYRSNSQVGSSANECERTEHFPRKESLAGGDFMITFPSFSQLMSSNIHVLSFFRCIEVRSLMGMVKVKFDLSHSYIFLYGTGL